MLQFITNTQTTRSVVEQIKDALKGGCRWIQIRMKDATDDEIKAVVDEVKPLCEAVDGFLILDDRVELAKELNVGGVHLGKTDMHPSKARMILGAAAIIGVTANTFEDVKAVSTLDVDYIGIGPYRNTTTKENLAPILGTEGIRSIIKKMHEDNIEIPTVAIGGINPDDVISIMETGVNGIAVSGAISKAYDAVAATQEFVKILDEFNPQNQ